MNNTFPIETIDVPMRRNAKQEKNVSIHLIYGRIEILKFRL